MTFVRRALVGLAACAAAWAPGLVRAQSAAPPRIVALVVVDQLPAGLLDRYQTLWTGGFRRLREQGYQYSQAAYPYDFTETAPGHATLATGVPPSLHGIVSNDFLVEESPGSWRQIYAVADADSPILGIPNAQGRGPRNLAHSGLASWMAAARPQSRIVGISKKDRSAISLIGDAPNAHVYWLQARQGRFVTSRHYRDAYPDWVERFNRETMPSVLADTVWESSVPRAAAALSRPDTFAAEGDGVHTAFPHRAWLEATDTTAAARNTWVSQKPVLDSAVLELTLHALTELQLGQDSIPDFLAVGFSQTDEVGHDYGPGSREQLDNLLRLDRILGRLFDALDAAAGIGRWTLALSSDHGVLEIPEWAENGKPVGRRLTDEERSALEDAVAEAAAQVREGGSAAAEALRVLRARPEVAAVYPLSELAAGERADSFAVYYANGIFAGRVPDELSRSGLRIRLQPGTLLSDSNAATHGSPYWYDRHVPLFFLGAGFSRGSSPEPVSPLDVAPTLARLAGVRVPPDVRGRALISTSP